MICVGSSAQVFVSWVAGVSSPTSVSTQRFRQTKSLGPDWHSPVFYCIDLLDQQESKASLTIILQFRDAAAIKIIGGRGDGGRQAAVDRIIEADHFTIKKFRQALGLLLDRLRATSGGWHRPRLSHAQP